MYRYKISKKRKAEFAEKMKEIEAFCLANNIHASITRDSYYFALDGKRYRVSNHTIEASNLGRFNWLGEETRPAYHGKAEEDTVCITAGKTRIIEIYTALQQGKKLDKRGNIKD